MRLLLILMLFSVLCYSQKNQNDSIKRNTEELDKKRAERDALESKRKSEGLPSTLSEEERIETIYDIVSNSDLPEVIVKPVYPGGFSKLDEFIEKNISVSKNCSKGEIFVEYIVNETGEVTYPRIVNGLSPECNKAMIDVMKKLPKFKPAKDKKGNPRSFIYGYSHPFK